MGKEPLRRHSVRLSHIDDSLDALISLEDGRSNLMGEILECLCLLFLQSLKGSDRLDQIVVKPELLAEEFRDRGGVWGKGCVRDRPQVENTEHLFLHWDRREDRAPWSFGKRGYGLELLVEVVRED